MANNYKNIVITPNRDTDAANVPVIRFSGGDATTNADINVRVYTTQNGTLSFEGSAGQLFSITNDLTGTIFSVNDVSGIPSIEVNASGLVTLASYGGNVGVGRNTVNTNHKLDVAGIVNAAAYYVNGQPTSIQGTQGTQGANGFQGFQGIQGRQGIQGANGFQGIQGTTGTQGANGFQGIQGTTGSQGIQGTTGTQGANGFQGIQGANGFQGIQGTTSSQGIQGANGFQGIQGTQGANGTQGLQGIQGRQGIQGANGFQGIQGTQGANGTQGIQGTQGTSIQGSSGTSQGIQGIQGIQGTSVQGTSGTSQGIQGIQGRQGIQGIQGTSVQGIQGALATATSINATAVTTDTKLYPVLVYAAGSNQTAQTITSFTFNSLSSTFTLGANSSGSAYIVFNGGAPTSVKGIQIRTSDVARWYIGTDAVAEGGSNTGSSLVFQNSADDGSAIGTVRPLTIYRANGTVAIANLSSGPITTTTVNGTIGTFSGAVYSSNWFRTYGDTGWYNETYGGGINMTDTTWVRTYNNKRFWIGAFAADNSAGNDNSHLQLQNAGGTGDANCAVMTFHCAGQYGSKLHLRPDGYFGAGGWSATAWRWYVNLANGDMTAAGNITAYSDIRLKENITSLINSLYKIKQLNGVRFTWKDIPDVVGTPGKADFGILAHEVEAVAPELISESAHKSPDGDPYKTVAYDKLVPMLIEAIKELSGQVDDMKQQIKELKEKS